MTEKATRAVVTRSKRVTGVRRVVKQRASLAVEADRRMSRFARWTLAAADPFSRNMLSQRLPTTEKRQGKLAAVYAGGRAWIGSTLR